MPGGSVFDLMWGRRLHRRVILHGAQRIVTIKFTCHATGECGDDQEGVLFRPVGLQESGKDPETSEPTHM